MTLDNRALTAAPVFKVGSSAYCDPETEAGGCCLYALFFIGGGDMGVFINMYLRIRTVYLRQRLFVFFLFYVAKINITTTCAHRKH